MRILIVDDEPLVRVGIKSCTDWSKYGMEVVGEASDGMEALEQIRRLLPDVVLLDLKMPNMDGIELMRRIKEENINVKILVLSGFDDFYHIKEAMKLGAEDYLHKPCMNIEDILNTLTIIKQKIKRESSSLKSAGHVRNGSENTINTINTKKNTFLKGLADGCAETGPILERKLKENNIRFKPANISCIVFCIRNVIEVSRRYGETDENKLQSSIYNIMIEALSTEKEADFFIYDKNTFAVIASCKGIVSEKRITENTMHFVHLVQEAMKQFLNVDIVIGVSGIHQSYAEVSNAFKKAHMALKHSFYLDECKVINYNDIKVNAGKDALIRVDSLIEKAKNNLYKQNYHEFRAVLEELFGYLKVESCLTQEEIKKLSHGLLFLIKEGKECLVETESINGCETLKQLKEVWRNIINEKVSESNYIEKYQDCGHLVRRIIDYIEKNHAADITLNLLSDVFYVSPNYISRIFREQTGKNLFNYLNVVRVENAKKLLKKSDLKIYEIGFRVGFKSTAHFNIVFNKLTGLSPRQYRNNL